MRQGAAVCHEREDGHERMGEGLRGVLADDDRAKQRVPDAHDPGRQRPGHRTGRGGAAAHHREPRPRREARPAPQALRPLPATRREHPDCGGVGGRLHPGRPIHAQPEPHRQHADGAQGLRSHGVVPVLRAAAGPGHRHGSRLHPAAFQGIAHSHRPVPPPLPRRGWPAILARDSDRKRVLVSAQQRDGRHVALRRMLQAVQTDLKRLRETRVATQSIRSERVCILHQSVHVYICDDFERCVSL
mmetsp:Transcript_6948/g.26788  ORF Transcript_6948/g.26788 Transcript_6948/m.26788 type:complete len:244 (+) Transcript_6948:1474-2205(+)